MTQEEIKDIFRKLAEPMPVKWRVGPKIGSRLSVLAYLDARMVQQRLDDVVGPENWANVYDSETGTATISIFINGEWVSKTDVGTESKVDKEKGKASDSFKRAATNIGIGRELYTSPFIWVILDKGEYYEKDGKLRASPSLKFIVSEISYSKDRVIDKLMLKDGKGQARFTFYNKEK